MNPEIGSAAARLTQQLLSTPGFVVAAAAQDHILCMVASRKYKHVAPETFDGFPVKAQVIGEVKPL